MIVPSRLQEFYRENPEHTPAEPIADIVSASERYQRQTGGSPLGHVPADRYSEVSVDPRVGAQIGRAYMGMPSHDPHAEESYQAFAAETGRQFEFMTGRKGGLGIDVSVSEEDPYESPQAMREDLQRGRMSVLSTKATGGHPFLDDDTNDMFRAVHDVFGHAGTGRGFDRHGEEAAWMKHSQMYSERARPAMTTETRGQNSAMIFSLSGQQFPEQKVGLLPKRFQDPSTTEFGKRYGRRSTGTGLRRAQFNLGGNL